ncbi:MAG: pyrroline-5-carboxylate reductase [Solirubrobacterales bacterium]
MKVGFAGAGNMAAAMARGWAGADGGPETMVFCDLERERASALAEALGGTVADDLSELAGQADLVVLGVKPAALDAVADELAAAGPRALLSMLAGTPLERIEGAFPGVPVVRVMPNQPVEVRRGVLCYVRGADVPDEVERAIVDLLELLGLAIELDEAQMEAAMAIMACSPAYVALVAEVLTDAGVREGLSPELAARFVAETFAGTGELLGKRDPAAIRRAVAPPGGATEAGLEALERGALRAAFDAAAEASLARVR